MNISKNILKLTLGSFVCLAILSACETYEFEVPNCYVIKEPLEIPHLYEIENEPIVFLNIGDEFTHKIIQLRLETPRQFCSQNDPSCLNSIQYFQYDKLFQLSIKAPARLADLENSVGVTTPLLGVDELRKLDDPTVYMGLTMFDSCRNPFTPVDSEQSDTFYNIITGVKERVIRGLPPEDFPQVEVTGRMSATFDLNGISTLVTLEYRLEMYVSRN